MILESAIKNDVPQVITSYIHLLYEKHVYFLYNICFLNFCILARMLKLSFTEYLNVSGINGFRHFSHLVVIDPIWAIV